MIKLVYHRVSIYQFVVVILSSGGQKCWPERLKKLCSGSHDNKIVGDIKILLKGSKKLEGPKTNSGGQGNEGVNKYWWVKYLVGGSNKF